jgi:hypothetical protein
MEVQRNHNILSDKEVAFAWKTATGLTPKPDKAGKYSSFSITLGEFNGPEASLELRPDYLNGRYKLLVREFNQYEGEPGYEKGLELVADFVQDLRNAGINPEIKVTEDFSDSESIENGINSVIASQEQDQQVA